MNKLRKRPPYHPVVVQLSFLIRQVTNDNLMERHVESVHNRLNFVANIDSWSFALGSPISRIKASIYIEMLSIVRLFPFLQSQHPTVSKNDK
jgi:hypothetical protein